MEGFLEKKGGSHSGLGFLPVGRRNWKRRWFVLREAGTLEWHNREVDPADDVGDSVPGGTGVRGGVLTVFEEEMPRFNPLYPRGMVDVRSQELVFDRLFYQDAGTGEMRSRLVRKFQVQDGGLALLVTLRGDVRWHDGTPLTAADVCFTVAAQVQRLHADALSVQRVGQRGIAGAVFGHAMADDHLRVSCTIGGPVVHGQVGAIAGTQGLRC